MINHVFILETYEMYVSIKAIAERHMQMQWPTFLTKETTTFKKLVQLYY